MVSDRAVPDIRTANHGRPPDEPAGAGSVYSETALRNLRDRIEVMPVLKAINYRLDTIQETPDVIKCFCPIHKEAVFRTLAVDRRTRRYRCTYSLCPGNKGGDLIDLCARALKIDYDEAVQRLVQALKISIELPPSANVLQKTLEVSENYLALGSYNDALAGFKKVLATQPDNLRALKGLLEIHRARNEDGPRLEVLERLIALTVEQGQFAQGADFCRELLEKQPNDTKVRTRYIECLIHQKEMQRALEEYMRLADYFETRQEFDRALEIYRKIEQLNLDIIDVYPHIIQLMVASDHTQDAVAESLRKAAEHERQGEYEQALVCYRTILGMEPGRRDISENMVDAAIRAGLNEGQIEECLALVETFVSEESYTRAIKLLEKLHQAAPKHIGFAEKYAAVLRLQGRESAATEIEIDLIALLLEQKRSEEAAAKLRQITPSTDLTLDSLKQLADIQRRCGLVKEAADTSAAIAEQLAQENRLEEAADLYEVALESRPDELSYRNRQIELYLRVGRADRAREKYAALLETLIAQGQWDAAARAVGRALEIAPEDLQLLECQTRILEGTGRIGEAQVRYMALAQRAVGSREWTVAKRILQRILAIEPDNVEAALLLADVGVALADPHVAREDLVRISNQLLCQKNYPQAKVVLHKLHQLVPDDVLPLVHLAAVYGNLGEEGQVLVTLRDLVAAYIANGAYAKALEYCTTILDRDPENIWTLEQLIAIYEKTDKVRQVPEVCLRLARIHEKLDETDRVQEHYERALEIDPADAQARSDYVQFLLASQRFDLASQQVQLAVAQLSTERRFSEAVQMAENLLEHTPDDVALRRSLVDLCRKAGLQQEFVTQCTQLINLHYQRNEIGEVADLYRELLTYEPTNVTFRTRLIDAFLRLKRFDEAIEQYLGLATFYLDNSNFEDAETTLLELLNQAPGNTRALDMLVEILLKVGRIEEATKRARDLSEIYVGTGKNDRAAEVLRRVLRVDPRNREISLWLEEIIRADQVLQNAIAEHCRRATSAWESGDIEAAIAAQREAVRLQPEDADLLRRLEDMLASQARAPENVEELLQTATRHVQQEQHKKALEVLDKILVRDPSHYAARRLRAEVFLKLGDDKRALDEFSKLPAPGAKPQPKPTPPPAPSLPAGAGVAESLQIVPDFTFDSFVIGDRNRFAHATALAVAKAPAMHYNPLFIYSDVGLGKTHLISAIANYIIEHQPSLRILYTSAEEFTSQLVDAIQNNTINALRSRYKAADVLMVDDIQFLAGKERAQEEFFHIFNTLFQAKRQIVVTCDRPPREIEHLEKRLKSRFGSGVIVDIQTPDFETRAAILKKDLRLHEDVQLDNRLIHLIAERIQTNVRELKGALKQVIVMHELGNAEIDEALVLEVLERYSAEI